MKRPVLFTFLPFVLVSSLILTACNEKEAVFEPAVASLIQKADAFHKAGDTGLAICRLEAAADLTPEMFQVQYNLGVLYTENHQWQKATEHLEKAVETNPGQASGFFSLGYAYAAWGDELSGKMEPAAPKPSTKTHSAPQISPLAGDPKTIYPKAIAAYEQFLKIAPDSDPGRQAAQSELTRIQAKTR